MYLVCTDQHFHYLLVTRSQRNYYLGVLQRGCVAAGCQHLSDTDDVCATDSQEQLERFYAN